MLMYTIYDAGSTKQPNQTTDQIQGKPKSMPTMFALNKIAEAIEQRWTHQAKKWRLLQGFIR